MRRLLSKRMGWRAGVLIMFATLALLIPAHVRAQLVDASGVTHVASWLAAVKEVDEVAFAAHAALGRSFCLLACDPAASGLQWLKAAAHARTPAQAARASEGLQKAAERIGSAQALADRLCRFVADGYANRNQQQIVEEAGLTCPPS